MSDEVQAKWMARVEEALAKTQLLPVMDASFPFPWSEAGDRIGKALGLRECKLTARPAEWKMEEAMLAGMGNEPVVVSFEVAPIDGTVQWMMSSEDLSALTAACLSSEQKTEGFSDRRLQEGFYQFLLLQTVHVLDEMKALPGTALRLLPQGAVPKEGAACTDIAIALPHKTVYGRLICPQTFLTALKSFQPMHKKAGLTPQMVQGIEVSLRVELGSTTLSPEEWRGVMAGDFIALDHASYDPAEGKGSVTLLLGTTTLFLARLKPDGIKIADYAFYYAAAPEPEAGAEPLPDEDLDKDHLWESEEASMAEIPSPEKKIFLTVELDAIRMPASNLLELKADQTLDIPFRPDQSVHVMIEGKQVASGDLLRLGETVGVRILAIHG